MTSGKAFALNVARHIRPHRGISQTFVSTTAEPGVCLNELCQSKHACKINGLLHKRTKKLLQLPALCHLSVLLTLSSWLE